MKIYSLKKYLNKPYEKNELINQFYECTSFLNEEYPNYKKWFAKHIKECNTPQRDVLFAMENNVLAGFIFLKNDVEESKICTLYVKPEYRRQYIATKLIESSFEFLQTTKPYLTMNSNKFTMFKTLFNKYGWKITKEVDGLYKTGEKELILNNKKFNVKEVEE